MKINQEAWDNKFRRLIAFKKKYRRLPSRTEEFPKGVYIGEWCHKMRVKKKFLSKGMVSKLNQLGFIWDLETFNWLERFKEIESFKRKHRKLPTYVIGHTNYELKLSGWLAYQRKKFREGSLDTKQVSKLKRAGVITRH